MLNQPHSAVNQLNYGSIGSHTLQDAGANARNHISKDRRIQNMKQVQQNNRNAVGLPNTNKQIGNLGSSSVYLDAGLSMSTFLSGIALMGLTKTYNKRAVLGTGAQALAGGAFLVGLYQYFGPQKDATMALAGAAGVAGLTLGANLFKVKMAPGFVRKITKDFRRLAL